MTRGGTLLLIVVFVALIALAVYAGILHAQAPTSVPWFSITSGSTTCRATQIVQTPIRISYLCFNTFGATAGSYTADATNGVNGGNIIMIGLNSMGIPANPVNDSMFCTISMNSTTGQLVLNGVTVQANSASYSCAGTTGPVPSGQGSITWPAP
jgi:hypothetical protein